MMWKKEMQMQISETNILHINILIYNNTYHVV